MDRFQRKYFFKFAKHAPTWLAASRAKYCLRIADAAIRNGDNAKAVKLLEEGMERLRRDYAVVDRVAMKFADEPDAWLQIFQDKPGRAHRLCGTDRATLEMALEDALASAKVLIKPRRIGSKIKVGVVFGPSQKGALEYFADFENVEPIALDSISLANLDRCDCVFLPSREYDKKEFFANLKIYVERGGGGVCLEGQICGHKRFDAKTPFPQVVKTSPSRADNFSRRVKTTDGKESETMYIDYFILQPGPDGVVRAVSPDGKPICVAGKAGLGKVFFNGTFNVESVNGTYDTRSAKLYGFNAEMAREAVEYFTGIRLLPKADLKR
jgi:hypothetical protein